MVEIDTINAVDFKDISPYPGLRPFRDRKGNRRGEEHLFFGRERHTDLQIEILDRSRFLAVVGVSGSGKSSLVNCGLLQALHGGYMASAGTFWHVVKFRPGEEPLEKFADALARTLGHDSVDLKNESLVDSIKAAPLLNKKEGGDREQRDNVLIVVDQFEELFRFMKPQKTDDGSGESGWVSGNRKVSPEAKRFVDLLLESTRQWVCPLYVVITMRSDYLGECTQFDGLPDVINESLFLVPRIRRGDDVNCNGAEVATNGRRRRSSELRDAIEGPVAVTNLRLQHVYNAGRDMYPFNKARVKYHCLLLQKIQKDLGDEPAHLPILQHALNRTFDEWKKDYPTDKPHKGVLYITTDHYNRAGGIAGALNKHADEIFGPVEDGKKRGVHTEGAKGLDKKHQEICKSMFKALTWKTPDGKLVRRETSIADLKKLTGASVEEILHIVEAFRKDGSFLLYVIDKEHLDVPYKAYVPGSADEKNKVHESNKVDISHESIMHSWQKLREWIDEEEALVIEFKKWLSKANEWNDPKGGGRTLSLTELSMFNDWRKRREPDTVWYERNKPAEAVRNNLSGDEIFSLLDDFKTKSRNNIRNRFLGAGVLVMGILGLLIAFGVSQYQNWQKELENLRLSYRANALVVSNHSERSSKLFFNPQLEAIEHYSAGDREELYTYYELASMGMRFNEESEGAVQDQVHQVLRKAYNVAAMYSDADKRDPLLVFNNTNAEYKAVAVSGVAEAFPEGVLVAAENTPERVSNGIQSINLANPDIVTPFPEVHQTDIQTLLFHPAEAMTLFSADQSGAIYRWNLDNLTDAAPVQLAYPEGVDGESDTQHKNLAFSSKFDLVSAGPAGIHVWNAQNEWQSMFRIPRELVSADTLAPGMYIPRYLEPEAVGFVDTESIDDLLIFVDNNGDIWRCPEWEDRAGIAQGDEVCAAYMIPDELAHSDKKRITSLAISGDTLVTASEDFSVRVWRVSEDTLASLEVLPGSDVAVHTVAINKEAIIAGNDFNEVLQWQRTDLKLRPVIFHDRLFFEVAESVERTTRSRIHGILFTPAGCFVTAGEDGTVRKWCKDPHALAYEVRDLAHVIAASDPAQAETASCWMQGRNDYWEDNWSRFVSEQIKYNQDFIYPDSLINVTCP